MNIQTGYYTKGKRTDLIVKVIILQSIASDGRIVFIGSLYDKKYGHFYESGEYVVSAAEFSRWRLLSSLPKESERCLIQ